MNGDPRHSWSRANGSSGHGGQAKDTDGDEDDGFDEVIYPLDYKQAGHIVDDERESVDCFLDPWLMISVS